MAAASGKGASGSDRGGGAPGRGVEQDAGGRADTRHRPHNRTAIEDTALHAQTPQRSLGNRFERNPTAAGGIPPLLAGTNAQNRPGGDPSVAPDVHSNVRETETGCALGARVDAPENRGPDPHDPCAGRAPRDAVPSRLAPGPAGLLSRKRPQLTRSVVGRPDAGLRFRRRDGRRTRPRRGGERPQRSLRARAHRVDIQRRPVRMRRCATFGGRDDQSHPEPVRVAPIRQRQCTNAVRRISARLRSHQHLATPDFGPPLLNLNQQLPGHPHAESVVAQALRNTLPELLAAVLLQTYQILHE